MPVTTASPLPASPTTATASTPAVTQRTWRCPALHRVASLLKHWLLGTHQGAVRPQQLDYYLDEYTFRFNRRGSNHRGLLFHRLLEQAVQIDHVPRAAIADSRRPAPIRVAPAKLSANRGPMIGTTSKCTAKYWWRWTAPTTRTAAAPSIRRTSVERPAGRRSAGATSSGTGRVERRCTRVSSWVIPWGKETRFGLAALSVGSVVRAAAAGCRSWNRPEAIRRAGPGAGRPAMVLASRQSTRQRNERRWLGLVAGVRLKRWRQARWCSRRRENALARSCRAAPQWQRLRCHPRLGSNWRWERVAVSFYFASLSRLGQSPRLGGITFEIGAHPRVQVAAEHALRLGAQELRPAGADPPRGRTEARGA
jgi:hypothetical protein